MTHTKQAIKLGLAALNCALIIFIFASMAHGQSAEVPYQTPISVSSAMQNNNGVVEVNLTLWSNGGHMRVSCNADETTCFLPLANSVGTMEKAFQLYAGTNVWLCFGPRECGVYVIRASY